MKPCDDCESRETEYVEKYETILCTPCRKKRDDKQLWKALTDECGLNPFKWLSVLIFWKAAKENEKSMRGLK